MEMISAIAFLPDINHPAIDYPVTKDADPSIIERIPFSKAIHFAKGDQLFRERDVLIHFGERLRAGKQFGEKMTIGTAPQTGVSKKPITLRLRALSKARLRTSLNAIHQYAGKEKAASQTNSIPTTRSRT
jgi:hypothetical protein